MALMDDYKDEIQTKNEEMDNLSKEDAKVLDGTENVKSDENTFDGEINLSAIRKKRFRIDGDNNRFLELDTSDMGIVTRLDNLYPKLQKLAQDAAIKQLDKEDTDNERALTKISQALTRIDAQMRQIVDEIFDSNVSEVCAPSGTMFDPFNGEFRYEHIIDVIASLYKDNITREFKKMAAKMRKHTAKYTKGR